jgi:hypothetical protein
MKVPPDEVFVDFGRYPDDVTSEPRLSKVGGLRKRRPQRSVSRSGAGPGAIRMIRGNLMLDPLASTRVGAQHGCS